MTHKCACGGPCQRCAGKCACTTCSMPDGSVSAFPVTPNTAFVSARAMELKLAVEFGFRCHEKGMNLQAALQAFEEL